MRRPRGVLIDIEGTTTRIAYVRDVLFPFARTRLPALLAQAADRREVATALAEVARLAPGQVPLDALLAWMDEDAKVTPLKTLQGIIWHGGYQSGELQGELYPDVAPALRRWHAAGIRLDMYSSGSAAAQRLLFGHSAFGDLTPVLSGFHDTAVGPKQRVERHLTRRETGNLGEFCGHLPPVRGLREQRRQPCAGEGKQHVAHIGDARGGAFDIDQNAARPAHQAEGKRSLMLSPV
jgi:2,3-diketo-5-methylthio-1-phosphopentane phosphatase